VTDMAAISGTLRLVEHYLLVHRRRWRSTTLTAIGPICYLAAIGVGLGSVIDRHGDMREAGTYLQFLAPGLLAATAMQTAASENAFPVAVAARIGSTFDLMLMTPLRVWHLSVGQLIWTGLRLLVVLVPLWACMVALRAMDGAQSLAALVGAMLCGLAFGPGVAALCVMLRGYAGIPVLLNLVITPLFLLGGVFFPFHQLPRGLQLAAELTPLYHGVELTRDLAAGSVGPAPVALHTTVLTAYLLVGTWLAQRAFERRLLR
jgi:lipooligosaccharide transport system permease protein